MTLTCKYLCGEKFKSKHQLDPHLLSCLKRKSSKAIIARRRGQAIVDEGGEGAVGQRAVVIAQAVNGEDEEGNGGDAAFDVEEYNAGDAEVVDVEPRDESYDRKIAKKVVKKFDKIERDIERRQNRRRPMDLGHY